MADHSAIEWTDATWNVITGCSVLSPGCKGCYAMKLAGTRLQHHPSRVGLTQPSAAGPVWTGEVRFNREWLQQPLSWKRPRDIFVCAHGDLFHPEVPYSWVNEVFGVMREAHWHRFQCLTKRPERALGFLDDDRAFPKDHVLIGVSVESQQYADQRRDALKAIAALGWRTWVSYEPALGPVDWVGWEFINWMVTGGESGQRARPSHPDWHRGARDWCAQHRVPYHFKQWGEWLPCETDCGAPGDAYGVADDGSDRELAGRNVAIATLPDHQQMAKVGKKAAGRMLDGVMHNGVPAVRAPP